MDLQIIAAFLESLFIFVILAALCHQRERIGIAPVLMAFGTIMFFGVIINAAEVAARTKARRTRGSFPAEHLR